MKSFPRLSAALAALLCFGFVAGCSTDSSDTFIRDVSVNFSGFYENPNSDRIVAQNTGSAITSLDLRQTGDTLEAVDNNGRIWRGSLGEVQNGRSSFELNGQTTAGTEATFSGNISSSDGGSTGSVNSANGTMQGTFIEPSLFSTFYAEASIPGSTGGSDDNSSGTMSLTSGKSQLGSEGATILQVNGGTGPFSWVISSGGGQLSAASTTVRDNVYDRGTATNGPASIRVTDTTGKSATTTITFI